MSMQRCIGASHGSADVAFRFGTDKGERNEGQRHSAGQGQRTLCSSRRKTRLWLAVQTMAENDIGSVVVIDHGVLVGMLTFREVIKRLHATRVRSATSL